MKLHMFIFIAAIALVVAAGLLVWYFLRSDKGPKEPRAALATAAGFGVVAIVVSVWAESYLPDPTSVAISIASLLAISMMIGLIEETSKFSFLALFIKKKPYFNEHTDGIIYFGIAGLAFGLIENFAYAFLYQDKLGGDLTGFFRLGILLFFHAAATGIVGYYFAKSKLQRQGRLKPLLALSAMIFIHGVYDFLFFFILFAQQSTTLQPEHAKVLAGLALAGGLGISALLNISLFLYYRRAQVWDDRRSKQAKSAA